MSGFYLCCNCCGAGFSNAPGARAYLRHLAQATYYGIRMSPETTWALGAWAREFLGGTEPQTFVEWCLRYYPGWKSAGPDILPGAYSWITFAGERKAPEYEAWRKEWDMIGGLRIKTFCENCDQDDEVVLEFDCGHWLCDFCATGGCPLCGDTRGARGAV